MNYAHNNAKLKKLQHTTEKIIQTTTQLISRVTTKKEEVELVVKQNSLPELPAKVN